jgi:hypothetical protein
MTMTSDLQHIHSAAAMLIGTVIGAIARFFIQDLSLYKFSPEFFFFVLLPPIIFEAGYSLDRDKFFENIGAITLYAFFGTLISTFIVGFSTFYAGKAGWISGISDTNPMEALLFGALISAVDPVATLSIMGSPELQCNEMLYSLVFGESVLNVRSQYKFLRMLDSFIRFIQFMHTTNVMYYEAHRKKQVLNDTHTSQSCFHFFIFFFPRTYTALL